jgi:hypothetical protein
MQDHQRAAGGGLDGLPVLESIHVKIEGGARVYIAANIQMVRDSGFAEVLGAVGEIVAAIDGPEVAESNDGSPGRATANVRDEESTPTRLFLKGLVEKRSIE